MELRKGKKGKIMSTQPLLTGKYSYWLNIKPEAENKNLIYINWDHVDQWRLLHQVTDGINCQEYLVLLTSEREQTEDVFDAKKRLIHWTSSKFFVFLY